MAKKNLIKKQPFSGKTAIVCGASKGIGKATAKEIVMLGGSVSIVARGLEALEAAKSEVEALRISDSQFVESIPCDVTDINALEPHFESFIEKHGIPDYLINGVGYALPQYFHKLTLDDFKREMEVNYFGQLVPTMILVPHYMEAKKGHIAFVSSVLGFLSGIGYASHAPTKYATLGLAESLRHELKPYNIDISVIHPADVDTPGFVEENKTKPQETALLSEDIKLTSAEKVAEEFVIGILKRKYIILYGGAKLYSLVVRFIPGIYRTYYDYELGQIRKKMGKKD